MAVTVQPGQSVQVVVQTGQSVQLRDWSTGLLGCFSDCGSLICGLCCLPCMMCRLASRMDECALTPCCIPGATVAMRTKIRTIGGIQGSICCDGLAMTFCGPCAVCQLSREMDNMGYGVGK